jgi:hypothetical protein
MESGFQKTRNQVSRKPGLTQVVSGPAYPAHLASPNQKLNAEAMVAHDAASSQKDA